MTGFMTEDHQDITGKREGSFDRNVFHGTSCSLRDAITGRSDRVPRVWVIEQKTGRRIISFRKFHEKLFQV